MKLSARMVMNRVNLWQRSFSISSACLMLMLSRIELTEGSMSTLSFSLRDMTRGINRTSCDVLMPSINISDLNRGSMDLPCFNFGFVVSLYNLETLLIELYFHEKTSLITWDAKFSNVIAAVKVDRTAARYGRSAFAYQKQQRLRRSDLCY